MYGMYVRTYTPHTQLPHAYNNLCGAILCGCVCERQAGRQLVMNHLVSNCGVSTPLTLGSWPCVVGLGDVCDTTPGWCVCVCFSSKKMYYST